MGVVLAASAAGGAGTGPLGTPEAEAQDAGGRYALANGCYGLRSRSLGRVVAKSSGGGYAATAGGVGEGERFRMQATDLGKYLLFGRDRDFMAAGPENRVQTASSADASGEWRVDVRSGAFRITSLTADRVLAVGDGGQLVLADPGSAGDAALFAFERAEGCAEYPEAQVNAVGGPSKGTNSYHEVSGFLDAHLHLMAFEFLGGSIHCGRPWHPYGVTHAMVDCPDHGPGGVGAALEHTISYGNPARTHDTVGWPTFRDWPHHQSLTHEGVYYKGLERAWRGGLRLFVNLLVDNAVLCELYPLKRNPCDEMNTVRLELKRTFELQDYIDAQNGGPGKGWFRVVRDPFEARRVINQGKLAVVLGIENSRLFDCTHQNNVPECDRETIDRQLKEFYEAGVRSLELVNKFDNALVGVAGDAGNTGVVVNAGNRYETGMFWDFETCTGEAHDKEQHSSPGGHNDDALMAGLQMFLPPGSAPVYPDPPHCNTRGLSELGEYVIRRMMERGMILDPDHMSALGASQAISVAESKDYGGIVSSHSWSHSTFLPRIYKLGGVVTPYAGSSTGFVHDWQETKPVRDRRFYFGFGYGADMNGFGAQGGPRGADAPNPVRYPFRSFDGAVTLDRQRWGERVWDINTDGVAQYGLYPDWIEDLRMLAGDQIVEDLSRGPESYLQMWERANGVRRTHCRPAHEPVRAAGIGRVRLGDRPEQVLRAVGQPGLRRGRIYRYCVGARGRFGKEVVVFTGAGRAGLISTTAPGHRALSVGTGARAGRLPGRARRVAPGLWIRRTRTGARLVYGVRRGRVSFVAVASPEVARSIRRLRSYLRLAGVL